MGIPRRVSSLECLGVAAWGEKLKLVNLRHAALAMRPGCGTEAHMEGMPYAVPAESESQARAANYARLAFFTTFFNAPS